MAYGKMPAFFVDAVEAEQYLDGVRRSGNYSAESYQDRVRARNCILVARGWSPPPIKEFTREEIAESRLRAARILNRP